MVNKNMKMDPYYLSILNYIKNNQPIHPNKLAKEYGVTRQAIDHRLRILEKYGYVRRIWRGGKVYYILTKHGMDRLNRYGGFKYRVLSRRMLLTLIFISIGFIGLIYNLYIGNVMGGLLSILFWAFIGIMIFIVFPSK